jgi:hypothetical protein
MSAPHITIAQEKALATALTDGYVSFTSTARGRRVHGGVNKVTRQRLVIMGLLTMNPPRGGVWPSLSLTDEGRAVALTLADRESSASRQHWIETGRYLRYSDRPELTPDSDQCDSLPAGHVLADCPYHGGWGDEDDVQ